MEEPLGLGLASRLELAADTLREQAEDLRWLVDALALRLEMLLPGQVTVERGFLRRRVRRLTIQVGDRHFECRPLADGRIETLCADVRRGIIGRRQEVPAHVWVQRLEAALDGAAEGAGAERDAMGRLVE